MCALASNFISAQAPDNDFQSYFAKVNNVLQKSVESMNKADAEMLRDANSKSNNYFGEAFQNSMRTLKQSAKSKLLEYEEYLANKKQTEEKFKQKETELSETQNELMLTKEQRDSLSVANAALLEEIDKLTKRVKKLSSEKGNIEKLNKKLIEDSQSYQSMLNDTRKVFDRMQNLLSASPILSEMQSQLPATLKDSLESIECGVSESLMKNFTLTLDGMKKDEKYIDSIAKIYADTKKFPADLEEYFEKGKALSDKMTSSSTDCVRISGNSILNSIEEFKQYVEERSKGTSLDKILLIPGIILLAAIIIVIIFLVRKKR